jgi:integrase
MGVSAYGGGSIVAAEDKSKKRCRKWRIFVSSKTGKRKSKTVKGTYADAVAELEELKLQMLALPAQADSDITFSQMADRWFAWRKGCGSLSAGTLRNNSNHLITLKMFLGDKRLSDIKTDHIKRMFLALRAGDSRSGRPLSGTTLNAIYVDCNAIFRQAVQDEYIAKNPCDGIKPPKTDTKERPHLTPAQLDRVFAYMAAQKPDGFPMAVMLMVDTGLRTEEAMALRPCDIDTSFGIVSVRGALKECTNTIGPTKSPAGVRDIPMSSRLKEACKRWEAERIRLGISDSETFCSDRAGRRFTLNAFRCKWNNVRDDCGASGITPHELRHSFLTKLGRVASAFTMQKIAGWDSIAPARRYVHTDFDALRRTMEEAEKC